MQLSVIVVTHDSSPWLEGFATSWRATAQAAPFDWEILIADAGSRDDTANISQRLWPQAHLLSLTNLGYGTAANRAAAAATGQWLLFCNPDLTFPQAFATAFLAPAMAGQFGANAGCIAPQLLNPDGSVQPSVGPFFTLAGLLRDQFRPRPRRKYLWPQPTTIGPVDWAMGACLLVRRDLFQSIGGFDEKYFLYVEEVDLQRRLADQGHRTVFVPLAEAGVTHHQPNAARTARPEVQRWAARGNLRYFAKHGGFITLVAYRAMALATGRLPWREAMVARSAIIEKCTGP